MALALSIHNKQNLLGETCSVKSAASQVHDWVVYRLGGIFGSVVYRVKIHKITPATDKERDDLEIKDYVVLQKPQEQTDRLPPPRTLILDFTLTHTSYGNSNVYTTGQLILRAVSYDNIKGSVGLILTKVSVMRISIPLDLSSRPFIPLPRFICRRRPLPLLAPSLVFTPRCSV